MILTQIFNFGEVSVIFASKTKGENQMANCLYSGDKPLGIVQSNAEDVAYDSNTNVKEAIDGVVVKSIPANTYNTYALALAELLTYFNGLTLAQKYRAKIIRNDRLIYDITDNAGKFATLYVPNNQGYAIFQTISLDEGKYYEIGLVNGQTISVTNLSNNRQINKLELIV